MASKIGRLKVKTSWRPGQSGNPNGSPKRGNRLSEFIDKWLDLPVEDLQVAIKDVGLNKKTIKEVIAIRYLSKVVQGDKQFMFDHRNRTEGVPIQTNKMIGDPDNPVSVNTNFEGVLQTIVNIINAKKSNTTTDTEPNTSGN